ncbi:MAG: FGGY-family carbohydrate kinase, partial [Actinomycetota bacterium]
MLNVFTGDTAPTKIARSSSGMFPLVAFRHAQKNNWASEAIMLSAGTNIDWLRQDVGLIESAEHSSLVASQVADSNGVVFVPALFGLGTPHWDYGARGTMLGLTRGSTRNHVVRAVLEGVAHRGADLVDAA